MYRRLLSLGTSQVSNPRQGAVISNKCLKKLLFSHYSSMHLYTYGMDCQELDSGSEAEEATETSPEHEVENDKVFKLLT